MARFNITSKDLKDKGYANVGGVYKKLDQPKATPFKRVEMVVKKVKQLPPRPLSTPAAIFMPGNVPSSKNSRDIVTNRATGHSILIPSRAVVKYKAATKNIWPAAARSFREMCIGKEKPLRIQFYFYRASNHRFDFHNAVQVLCDLMTLHGWINDDDVKNMVPVPPPAELGVYKVHPHPGVFISVL